MQQGRKLRENYNMTIDHICFAVKSLDEGISYWKHVFGYRQKTEMVINSLQKVKVVFLDKDNSLTIKLIEPLNDNHSLINFVNKGRWISPHLL